MSNEERVHSVFTCYHFHIQRHVIACTFTSDIASQHDVAFPLSIFPPIGNTDNNKNEIMIMIINRSN